MKGLFLKFIVVTFCLAMGLVSCKDSDADTESVEQQVNYMYSSQTLDSTTLAIKQQIIDENWKQSSSSTAMKAYLQYFQTLDYNDYDGALPVYNFRLDTMSILSSRGFKTIRVKAGKESDLNIIYIHGGAWAVQIAEEHLSFVEKVSDKINADVYVPLYPMIPRWNSADAYEMLKELYTMLLNNGKPVLLMGDSAGGNMVFGFTFYLRSLNIQLPKGLVALSPALDLTASNPEIEEYNKRDIYIDKSVYDAVSQPWADSRQLTDPIISPVFGDPTGFPSTLIYVGDEEIMYPDVIRYAETSASKGIETTVFVGRGLWHVAPLSDIPCSTQFFDLIANFVTEL